MNVEVLVHGAVPGWLVPSPGEMCGPEWKSRTKVAAGWGVGSRGLVCLGNVLTEESFALSRNWLALGGAAPSVSVRAQMSTHRNLWLIQVHTPVRREKCSCVGGA